MSKDRWELVILETCKNGRSKQMRLKVGIWWPLNLIQKILLPKRYSIAILRDDR